MKFLKNFSFFSFSISVASSVSGHTTSHVTNNTNKAILVYWTATGCTKIHNGVDHICKHQVAGPHKTVEYKFKGSQSDLQIKISSFCKKNPNPGLNFYIFCPSGSWHLNGGYHAHYACKLHGKHRGHVKNVIINDFSKLQDTSNSCTKIKVPDTQVSDL